MFHKFNESYKSQFYDDSLINICSAMIKIRNVFGTREMFTVERIINPNDLVRKKSVYQLFNWRFFGRHGKRLAATVS